MKLILDSNVIFSCLLSGKKLYLDLLSQNQCFSPDFIFEEIKKYEKVILKKGKPNVNFKEYVKEVFTHLVVIPRLAIGSVSWKKAYELCKGVDEKDTAYVALSIDFDLPLVTRDKKLYNGLKKKQFENIIIFETFLEHFKEKENIIDLP